VQISQRDFLPIVADAAMAGPFADGRMIPVLILDAAGRPEVEELIRVHQHLPPGDVVSAWGGSGSDDEVVLLLEFERPIRANVNIRFSISRQGGLVDLIVRSGATYLQTGKPGDRLLNTMDSPRILVEVNALGFEPIWERLLMKQMTRVFRQGTKLSKRQAAEAARQCIDEFRELGTFRMPRQSQ
jgi:hypothetical protein